MKEEPIIITDCTLRDGEQAPGVFFTLEEKLAIADLLDFAGVDILDAGMPSTSAEERKALEALLDRGYRAKIAGTVRALPSEIDLAADCGLKDLFLVMPVSPQHLKHKFGITLKEAQPRIEQCIDHAVNKGLVLYFVAEDTVRADPLELAPLFDRISELGAAGVMVCDTVGVMEPESMADYVRLLTHAMKTQIPLGIHCHNDYGLAVANTLAAIREGCTHVTATVNGLGERAGNAALEEVVCALYDLYDADIHIERSILPRLCEKVAVSSGVFLMPTKPIAGLNVFRHESGIHVDGMLKDPSTYESISPEKLGRHHEFLLGKHSGRGLVESLLGKRGMQVPPEMLAHILERIKEAKVSRDKVAFAKMWEQLSSFWAEHLSFSEEEFWKIVLEETTVAGSPLSMERPARPEEPRVKS